MPKFLQSMDCSLSLEQARALLSLEDAPIGHTTSTFQQLLPGLVDKLKTLEKGFELSFLSIFSSKEKRVLSHLNRLNYTNLSGSLVATPEGFKGHFVDYLKVLSDMQNIAFKDANEFIKEYQFHLSAFITNKDNQISAQDLSFLYNRMEQRTLESKKTIAEFFNAPNKLARAKVGDVLYRMADLETIDALAKQIESQHNVHTLKDIELSVNKIIAMLEMVIAQMKNADISKVSRQAAVNLSEGAYQLAQYIEFISLLHYRISAMLKVVDDLFVYMNKQL